MSLGQFILSHFWQLLGMLAMLLGLAFFGISESAFFSLSRSEILRFRTGSHRVGHVVASLMHRPARLLTSLLLGSQLLGVGFYAMAAGTFLDLGHIVSISWPVEVVLVLMPLLVVVLFGEVGPKVLGYSYPARFAQLLAVPNALLVRVLGPIQVVLSVVLVEPLTRLLQPALAQRQTLSTQELASLLELSHQRGLIASNESDWLKEIIELSRLKVGDIMVPRVDMVAYDADQPPAGLVQLFCRSGLVRIPVYRGDLDDILGLVYAKDLLLAPATPLASLVRPVHFVPETATVDKLLAQFRKTRSQMAIVVDEYGGTAGLVSLEDALEEIVGDISGPGEQVLEAVTQVGPNEYLVDGDLPIHQWHDTFDIPMDIHRVSTIGGLVMSLLGRLPKVGDIVRYRNLEFMVESMRRHRIARVRLRLKEAQS